MTSSTIERLRAKTLVKAVPEPTRESHEAYVAQLRALGADERTVTRLTRRSIERLRRG